ncbi:MAG: PilZ domain-containing protein [Proteobacteria bacterium]|nr:PilZ domain-containing protein [Pseudomonadota bacterium]
MMPAETTSERRRGERFPIMMTASVAFADNFMNATIFDVSSGGAKVRLDGDEIPAEDVLNHAFILNIPAYGKFPGDIVWKDDEYIGIQFHRDHSVELGPLIT